MEGGSNAPETVTFGCHMQKLRSIEVDVVKFFLCYRYVMILEMIVHKVMASV